MRIRYTVDEGGLWSDSVHTFNHPTNGAAYKTRVSLGKPGEHVAWVVFDPILNKSVKFGNSKSRATALKQAAKALADLGITVNKDTRQKRKVAQ